MTLNTTRDSILIRWAYLFDRVFNRGKIPSMDYNFVDPWTGKETEGGTATINVCVVAWRSILLTPALLIFGGLFTSGVIIIGLLIFKNFLFWLTVLGGVVAIVAIATGGVFSGFYVADTKCYHAIVCSIIRTKKQFCPIILVRK